MNLLQLYRRYSDPSLALIYQSGKVGSTALAYSIPGAVNVHDLYGNLPCPCGFRQRYSMMYRFVGFPVDRFVRRLIIKRRTSVDVIVPVRPPWERNISMFFEDLPFWFVHHFTNHRGSKKVEGLGLLREIFSKSFDHDYPDEWFQKEFGRFTGLALGEIDFDKSKGHITIEKGKFRCLILTTQHLRSENGVPTIESFLGRSFTLTSQNSGDKKWYGTAYKDFLADEDFVNSYQSKMMASKVQQKFFEVE